VAVIAVQRIHGQFMRVLAQIGGVGTMYNLGGINSVDIPRSIDRVEVTAFGDTSKVSVKGLPDGDVTFSAFYDKADTVMAALKASANPSYWWVYPNYEADKTRYYWVPGDVEFGYHSEINGAQTAPGGHIFATSSAIDAL
jgi:hypothetical protein